VCRLTTPCSERGQIKCQAAGESRPRPIKSITPACRCIGAPSLMAGVRQLAFIANEPFAHEQPKNPSGPRRPIVAVSRRCAATAGQGPGRSLSVKQTSHAMSNCYRGSNDGAVLHLKRLPRGLARTVAHSCAATLPGACSSSASTRPLRLKLQLARRCERAVVMNRVMFLNVGGALPNYALQRTGNDKVPSSWRWQPAAERGR
jgi:hypothetical protein